MSALPAIQVPKPCEERPLQWATVDLPAVAQHVLNTRRQALWRALSILEAGLHSHPLHATWRAFSHHLRQHLATEHAWLGNGLIPRSAISDSSHEHDQLAEQFTHFREALDSIECQLSVGLRWATHALHHELEEQIYCEQTLLFPRLRACREGLFTYEHDNL